MQTLYKTSCSACYACAKPTDLARNPRSTLPNQHVQSTILNHESPQHHSKPACPKYHAKPACPKCHVAIHDNHKCSNRSLSKKPQTPHLNLRFKTLLTSTYISVTYLVTYFLRHITTGGNQIIIIKQSTIPQNTI